MEEQDKSSKLFNKTQIVSGSDQMRVCPHCDKKFSSGKALGGHMRIHLPVKKIQSRAAINGESSDNPTCSLCGKIFPSMKSLFGHMRCHPERQWRGINPPAGNSRSSSVSDDHVDLMQSLPCWSVTGRRGRTGTVPVSEPSSSEEDEKFHDAAGELLLLAQIDSIGSNVTEKRIDEEAEIEDPNCIYRLKKQLIEEKEYSVLNGFSCRNSEHTKVMKTKKMKLMDLAEIEDPNCIHRLKKRVIEEDSLRVDETEYSVLNEYTCRNGENTKVKKARKMKLTVDLASFNPINQNPFDSPDKYKCSTCNKSFPTHQALGGHRSSHNKFKISTIDESSFAAAAVVTSQEHHQTNNGNYPNCAILHQCKICKKTFSTGQALGGHKRCHWTGFTESAGEPSQPSRRTLLFDLNEIPTIDNDDEEEEHGGGFDCDYALSSYNSNFLLNCR